VAVIGKNKCQLSEKTIIPPTAAQHFVSTQHRVKHIEATCSLSEIGAKSAKNLATSFYSQKAEEKKLSAALCAH